MKTESGTRNTSQIFALKNRDNFRYHVQFFFYLFVCLFPVTSEIILYLSGDGHFPFLFQVFSICDKKTTTAT